MPEPTTEPLALEATALRYAARTLSNSETAAFEARLGFDQSARDALSEAVRLSAAALRQDAPSPSRSFRSALRRRLAGSGRPMLWTGLGAGVVAAASLFAVQMADRTSDSAAQLVSPSPHVAPAPRVVAVQSEKHEEPTEPVVAEVNDDMRKAAEIWAELSTPEHVEKAHDDEAKLQHMFKNLRTGTGLDSHQP
jgi:hypothetical protein